MSASITLVQYGSRSTTFSPPCGKVRMALHLKGLEYEVISASSPGVVKKYNLRGRVPALIIGDETIVDSTDILTALDERFPNPPLMPSDPRSAALVKMLEDWADENLYFYAVAQRWLDPEGFAGFKQALLGRLKPPMKWVMPNFARRMVRKRTSGQGVGLKDVPTIRREFAECVAALDAWLEGQSFLVGESLTRADLAVASVIDQLDWPETTPYAAGVIRAANNVTTWLDRVHAQAPSARIRRG